MTNRPESALVANPSDKDGVKPGSSPQEAGVTLVELLVAIVISALVVGLVSRLFYSGQRAYLDRIFETDRLSTFFALKTFLNQALSHEVVRCGDGELSLVENSGEKKLTAWIQERFPEVEASEFRCLEVDGEVLSVWRNRFQPDLIEYRLTVRSGKALQKWVGSTFK